MQLPYNDDDHSDGNGGNDAQPAAPAITPKSMRAALGPDAGTPAAGAAIRRTTVVTVALSTGTSPSPLSSLGHALFTTTDTSALSPPLPSLFQRKFHATASAAVAVESEGAFEDDVTAGNVASDASITYPGAAIVIRHSSGVGNGDDNGSNGNDNGDDDGANDADTDDNDGFAKEVQHLVRDTVDGSVSVMGEVARPEKHPRLPPSPTPLPPPNHVHHQRDHKHVQPLRMANLATGVSAVTATSPARSQLQHITSRAAIKSSSPAQQQQLSQPSAATQRHSALAAAFAAAVATNATPPMKSHKTDAPMLNYIFDSHLATNKHIHHDRFVLYMWWPVMLTMIACFFSYFFVCFCSPDFCAPLPVSHTYVHIQHTYTSIAHIHSTNTRGNHQPYTYTCLRTCLWCF